MIAEALSQRCQLKASRSLLACWQAFEEGRLHKENSMSCCSF
jgi:hypothetical protein